MPRRRSPTPEHVPVRREESVLCALCGRQVPRAVITEHHLVPRERGGKPEHVVPMCRPCHGHVHALFDNKTLAASLNTLDALRRAPDVARFVRFIRKQDPAARFHSVMANHHSKKRRRRRS